MKIIILSGSPHKKGSSNLLAAQFVRGAEEAGHTVRILDVAHMDIRPCLGCDCCGTDGECVRKDDNANVRDEIISADMVVFVTPVYYFGMSSQLKTVIDRFYSYNSRLQAKKLKTALIAAAWDSDNDVMTCTVGHYKKICSYMNFTDIGAVLGTRCGTPEMTAQTAHMNEAYELGKSL